MLLDSKNQLLSGDLSGAIDTMLEYISRNHPERDTDISLIKYQYKVLKKKVAEGIVTNPDIDENKIAKALLFLIEEITNTELRRIGHESIENLLSFNVEQFKKWRQKFVHLDIAETKSEVVLFVEEIDSIDKPQVQEPRTGSVGQIIAQMRDSDENFMILVGDAGMGKSTSLQYLSYSYSSQENVIPVFIELKLYEGESINEFIESTYSTTTLFLEKAVVNKDVFLFADGFNEIPPSRRLAFCNALEHFRTSLISSSLFIILSSRQEGGLSVFRDAASFQLKKMNKAQIQEFLQKNVKEEELIAVINRQVLNNYRWSRILSIPLYLMMLINLVRYKKGVPNDESKIIYLFIWNILKREEEKRQDFNSDYFYNVLAAIAFTAVQYNSNTNAGLKIKEITKLVTDRSSKIDLIDTYYVLQTAIELNLVIRDKNIYSFSHQVFQEVLAADYLNMYLKV